MFLSTALRIAVSAAIVIGNQIKAGGVHYNIAWTEGFSAYDNNVSIAREGLPACGDRFEVAANTYYLEGCADPDTGYAQGRIGLWLLRGGAQEAWVQWGYA
ncbi:hypothetical protein LA080_007361 [Diaporthe eres]|nr:hypothetical protein LA080_007361 [Diaporthe eres]